MSSVRWPPQPRPILPGVTTISGTGASTATVAVVFPVGMFAQPPIVVPSSVATTGSAVLGVFAESVTASGFTLRMAREGGTFSGTYNVPWIAMAS